MIDKSEYGIIANVLETDRIFRTGAKVWLLTVMNGNFRWFGMSRGGRNIEKYAPITRFHNFRAAWVPVHMFDRVCWTASREDVEARAAQLNETADAERAVHPNRRR